MLHLCKARPNRMKCDHALSPRVQVNVQVLMTRKLLKVNVLNTLCFTESSILEEVMALANYSERLLESALLNWTKEVLLPLISC